MPVQRPSINKALLQAQLAKFYAHPVSQVSSALVLSLLCIMFFALVAIKPTLDTMGELIKQIDEKHDVDDKLSLKIGALATAQKELTTKAASANALSVAVPNTPDFTHLLLMIEKLASEHNVTFISLLAPQMPVERPEPSTPPTNIESIPLNLSLTGSYQDLFAFLKDLQNLQRIVLIDRVDIVPPSQQDDQSLSMSVALRAFAFTNTVATKTTSTTPGAR